MNRLFSFFILVTVCSLTACATGPPQTHPHLMVDPDGYALEDNGERMTPDAFDHRIETIISEVTTYVENVKSEEKTARILVYVHGGLVNQAEGLQFIEDMVDSDSGLLKGTDYYPVLINWDASLGSSMVDDIFMVRRGSRNPWSGIPTSPFVALARLIKGIIRFPESLLYQIETEIMPFESWKGEERSKSEMITGGTVSLVSLPTSIVSLPFITGFGEGAWKMLRRRTNQMFAYEIRPEKHPSIDQVHQPGALRQFFENIQHIASSDHPEIEITLVGHSMGAIVVNKILQAFPKIKFDRISYLGAAASIEDFMDTVPPYLDRYPDTTFYSFSLRNKDDGGEYNFLLPRGSLLVWIDNYYEPGISVTGRRVGYFKNKDIVSIRPMDGVCCSRMFFVKFTGLKGQPRKHGDFNDNGIFQSILQWANPNEIEQMEAAKEIVLHCPCKP